MKRVTVGLLVAGVLSVVVASLCIGAADVSLSDLMNALLHPTSTTVTHGIVWDVRLPRIAAALVCGASL